MKVRTLALAAAVLALIGAPALAQTCEGTNAPGTAPLNVVVTSLKSGAGEVAVTVYPDDSRKFLTAKGRIFRVRPATTLPTTNACFWVKPGFYGIAIYHDANKDHDFNRNAVGLPAEGFGFSNDAPTRIGLPSFASVRFNVPASGRTLRIAMRYQEK